MHFPARGKRGPVVLSFYTGGDMPPEDLVNELVNTFKRKPPHGCLLKGSKGLLSAGLWNEDCYVKLNGEERFVHHKMNAEATRIPVTVPRNSVGHTREWAAAIQTGSKTFSDFDIGGHLTEIGLAGIVALRLQKNIEWDGPNMKVPGAPEADAFVCGEWRAKWV